MRFGSVAFFKVLIKTVLCIAFFVPLVLCVIFAVLLWNKGAQLEEVNSKYDKLSHYAEAVENGERLSVAGFYEIYSSSGHADEDLIAYIEMRNGKRDPQTEEANGDKEDEGDTSVPQTTAKPEQTDAPDELDKPDVTDDPVSSPEETTESSDVPVSDPVSEYETLYADMKVPVPAEYTRDDNVVYLTFDDGPSRNTRSVLNYLDQFGIKATFFVVPQRTEECYKYMKDIVDRGHSIGVHSKTHDYKTIYASVEDYLKDFYEAWQMIYEATGVKTQIFRFPGGSLNDYNGKTRDAIIEEMTRRGFRYYDWNVDSNDSSDATWTEMYNSIPSDVAKYYRSFVLMHDSAHRVNTVYVLEDVIEVLIEEGYKFDKINNDTEPVQFIGPFA
ncbi:MAG: polysaccharide deacetylase [Oscillospiraceae bacterium]|nr:polysaccharide deacetylase [Oscillospiraceae bacterium]